MIIGANSVIYSTNPEADRAYLRDILKLTHLDVGHGWLIFGLPPSEVAVHPSNKNDVHEFASGGINDAFAGQAGFPFGFSGYWR